MGRLLVQVTAVASAAMLVVMWGSQRPSQLHRDYRPSQSQIWSTDEILATASDVANTAVTAASGAAEMAATAASDAASAAAYAANSAMASASDLVSHSTPNDDAIQSAIAGFNAAMERAPSVLPELAAVTPRFAVPNEIESPIQGFSALNLAAAGTAANMAKSEVAAVAHGEVPAVAIAKTECNRDHSHPLSLEDVLCRVPRGELAFISLANAAYGEMAVNWAMLLIPMLAKVE